MRRINGWVSVLSCLLFVPLFQGGCASSPPQMPITNSDERLTFNGFTVLPPEGAGWNWVGRSGQNKSRLYNTTFVKQDGDRTYVARVFMGEVDSSVNDDLDQLIVWLKASDMLREGPRQKGIAYTIEKDNTLGVPCVRYDLDAKDTRPVHRLGMVFDLDAHGFACPHPLESGVLVQIGYSRRSPQGQSYVAGLNEGERFLKSVQFTPIQR